MSEAMQQESFGGTARRAQRKSEDDGQVIDLPPIRLPGKYTIGGLLLAAVVAAIPTLQGGATKSEVATLNATVSSLTSSVSTLQATVSSLAANVASMQSTIEKLRDERSTTDKALANIEARLGAVERELLRSNGETRRQ